MRFTHLNSVSRAVFHFFPVPAKGITDSLRVVSDIC